MSTCLSVRLLALRGSARLARRCIQPSHRPTNSSFQGLHLPLTSVSTSYMLSPFLQARALCTAKDQEVTPQQEAQMKLRSMYASDWKDDNFPEWEQFVELNSKRPYYHNRATGEVSWAPPDSPDLDVFKKEHEEQEISLTAVPPTAPNGGLLRRAAACLVDVGVSLGVGAAFGLCVYIDLGNPMAAVPAVGFTSWLAFIARDMVIEKGTRSVGKKLMKLELVRVDGKLPSRWNNLFRQIYLPVYAGTGVLMPYIFFFTAADVACMLFTPYNMRIGDFIGRTRVIAELPDREERLQELIERDAADDLKE